MKYLGYLTFLLISHAVCMNGYGTYHPLVENSHFDCAKAPGSDDPKMGSINSIQPILGSFDRGSFRASQNRNFQSEGGITVTNATELQNAINAAATSATPTEIHIEGTITGNFVVPSTLNLITLIGNCTGCSRATLSGGGSGTILTLNIGALVDLKNLILRDGNSATGGAIFNNGGLEIIQCIIKNNTAHTNGGAIFNNTRGNVLIMQSSIISNTAQINGGAIFNQGRFFILECNVKNNRAIQANGGAIYNAANPTAPSSVIQKTTVSNNSAGGEGGAIINFNTPIPFGVQDSKIVNNTAVLSGGGISNHGDVSILNSFVGNNKTTTGNGGGIFNLSLLTLRDSDVERNSAVKGDGGGVANVNGTATVTDCEIDYNTALFGGGIANLGTGSLTLVDSHVKHNIATSGPNAGGGIFSPSSVPLVITDSKVCKNKPDQIAP